MPTENHGTFAEKSALTSSNVTIKRNKDRLIEGLTLHSILLTFSSTKTFAGE